MSITKNNTRMLDGIGTSANNLVQLDANAKLPAVDGSQLTNVSAGAVLQVKNVQTSAVDTSTTIIPHDDTIPQNTEGKEVMTLAITPTSSTNKLLITVNIFGSTSGPAYMMVALFQDSTAGALAAINTDVRAASYPATLTFSHYMEAGTTSETTFKVRAGPDSSGTLTINGVGGSRRFGGVAPSSITITEVAP